MEDGEDDGGEVMEEVLDQLEEIQAILEQMLAEHWWKEVMTEENFLHPLSCLHLICYLARIQYKKSCFLSAVWF